MSTINPALFPRQIAALKPDVEAELDRYSRFNGDSEEVRSFNSTYLAFSEGECPNRLSEAIRYSLLAPGKRIRPLLVLTSNQVCGGDPNKALPAACAVEMIHCYSLIHDDLPAMDDDELRRGRPSCHIQFDEATAILAGDALIPMAFEVICREIQPTSTANDCCLALAAAAGPRQLVGGQSDDLANQFSDKDLNFLEKIHHRKTGALLSTSLILGGLVAQASSEQLKCLKQYGKHLGLAFQIVDDLLDLRGDQSKIGKRTQKDSELGKLTYPGLLGEEESERRANEMTEMAIQALSPLGAAAKPLHDIARYVVQRTQ